MTDIKGYNYHGSLNDVQIKFILENYDKMTNLALYNTFESYDVSPVKYLIKQLVKFNILEPKNAIYKGPIHVRKESIDEFVLSHYKTMTIEEMRIALDVTTVTIYSRIRKYKVDKVIGEEYFKVAEKIDYTDIDLAVKRDYSTKCAKEISEDLNVDIKYVYVSASKLIRLKLLVSKVKKGDIINDRFKSA